MTRFLLPLVLALGLVTGGCGRPRPDDVAVEVSAIGGEPALADPSRGALDMAQAVMLGATAQGLVRFDANGQIVAGLAERWIVTDNGQSYIFRLRNAEWPDGSAVTAQQVVRALRRAAAAGSRNALAPSLEVIDEIVEMTPEVIEVRLRRPRPDLLKLFAQPELAVLRRDPLGGTGPFRIQADDRPGVLLRPAVDPIPVDEDAAQEPGPADYVRIHGESAALALARFQATRSDLILGGSFVDWPLIDVVPLGPANIRTDPAIGLFGFAIVERAGFLADADNRAAVSMAFDRAALTAAIKPDWAPMETLLPEQLDSAAPPAAPDWQPLAFADRRNRARARVALWRREHAQAPVTLRIALPDGPGATRLWGHIGTSLLAIGIEPVLVDMRADADLRLVDAVAPYDSARWFLATACRICSEEASLASEAARDAPTLPARARRIAEADAILTADTAFIPLAQPLRWSIVALRLGAWQGNSRAWHPLDQLRTPTE